MSRNMEDAPPGRLRLESRFTRSGTGQPERAERHHRTGQRDRRAAALSLVPERYDCVNFLQGGRKRFEPRRLKVRAARACATKRGLGRNPNAGLIKGGIAERQ